MGTTSDSTSHRKPWWRRDYPNNWLRLGTIATMLSGLSILLPDEDEPYRSSAVVLLVISVVILIVGLIKWRRSPSAGQ